VAARRDARRFFESRVWLIQVPGNAYGSYFLQTNSTCTLAANVLYYIGHTGSASQELLEIPHLGYRVPESFMLNLLTCAGIAASITNHWGARVADKPKQ
jgi:hypothetical protein